MLCVWGGSHMMDHVTPPLAPSPTALGQHRGLQGTAAAAAQLQCWVQRVQELVQGGEEGAKGARCVQGVRGGWWWWWWVCKGAAGTGAERAWAAR